jgi:hypothetical protein
VSQLPPDVARVLDDFVAGVRAAFADSLVAIVLYGSAAENALRPSSDVNVIVVLETFEAARAERVRPAATMAHAAVNLSAMYLLREEVPAVAAAFAQKFADVRRRRRVLYGDDVFAGLDIPRRALLTRLDQVLLNLTLRLRAAYVRRGQHEEQLVGIVADVTGPLRTAAASLLELEGRPTRSPKAALAQLATSFGPEWATLLAQLSEARERKLDPGAAGAALIRLVQLARLMRERVRALAR